MTYEQRKAARLASIMRTLSKQGWDTDRNRAKAERQERAARKSRNKPKVPSEWHEQRMLHEWLKLLGIVHFSVPNEAGYKDSTRQAQARMTGLSAGVPDMVLVTMAPSNGKPTAVEMKRSDKSEAAMTDRQRRWRGALLANGWNHVLGIGFDDARRKLEELGYGK